MSSQEPPDEWPSPSAEQPPVGRSEPLPGPSQAPQPWHPSRYPAQAERNPNAMYGAGGMPGEVDKGLVWGIAVASGVLAYGMLLALHAATSDSRLTAYESGRLLPAAAGSAVLVALITMSSRRLSAWWVVGPCVLALSGLAYLAIEVAPRAANDAKAEASGQDDYSLSTPTRAGEWRRMDDRASVERREQALQRIAQAPEAAFSDMDNIVYAEYRLKDTAQLAFLGLEPSGAALDDLRESSRDTLRDFMAGAGAGDPESVDSGDLGGSMGCTDEAAQLPSGMVVCAWADASTIGSVTIARSSLDIDEAAEITRSFRERVTAR